MVRREGGTWLTYVLKRKSCTKWTTQIYKLKIYLNAHTHTHTHTDRHAQAHTHIHTETVVRLLYKMAALSCSRHCRHSLPLTFPLYLSVCPLHFICLSPSLSLSPCLCLCFLTICVCLSVCPSRCLRSSACCLLLVCYLHSTRFLLSVSLFPLLPSSSSCVSIVHF